MKLYQALMFLLISGTIDSRADELLQSMKLSAVSSIRLQTKQDLVFPPGKQTKTALFKFGPSPVNDSRSRFPALEVKCELQTLDSSRSSRIIPKGAELLLKETRKYHGMRKQVAPRISFTCDALFADLSTYDIKLTYQNSSRKKRSLRMLCEKSVSFYDYGCTGGGSGTTTPSYLDMSLDEFLTVSETTFSLVSLPTSMNERDNVIEL